MTLTTRRDDLQCWRALSISAVLLFHIFPEQFPNGYLGVDIFFVLSGYLMACSYTFDSKIFFSITNFYYRRIKRILPIYLIIILITLLILARQVFPKEFSLILEDSRWAITLSSNYEDLLKERGYFDAGSSLIIELNVSRKASFRFFQHCWSLAVEMQFYLLFPLIAISRNFLSPRKYQLLLMSVSTGSVLYRNFSSNSIIQYESLFCRIWQFCVGMLAQTIQKFSVKLLPSVLLFGTSVIIFCPIALPLQDISIATVFITAGIISMSTTENHPFKTLFRIKAILEYIITLGDISYVLYLIHWPLIIYAKFMSFARVFSYFDTFQLLMTSIFLSKIVHVIIEKPVLKFCYGYKNLAVCLIILYCCLLYVPEHMPKKTSYLLSQDLTPQNAFQENSSLPIMHKFIPSNLTLQFYKEVSQNFSLPLILPKQWTVQNDLEFSVKYWEDYMGGAVPCSYSENNTIHFGKRKASYCEVMGINPNGTLVGLSFGNSFSMNIVTAVAANPLFKKVINIFISGSQFPADDDFERYLLETLIKPIKPDVTFIVQKYLDPHLYETPINKIHEHEKFKHWTKILKVIENYSSAIIMNKEQIIFPYDISTDFIRKKIYDLPVESRIKNPPPSPNLEAWLTALNCSKCGFFSYREAFCDGEFCNVLDLATGLPLYRDVCHISILGIRRIKPLIDKAIYKALKICV